MSSKNVKAAAVANYCGAMESETISKNRASPKSHMSRGNNFTNKLFSVLLVAVLTAGLAQAQSTFGARAGINFTNKKITYIAAGGSESVNTKMKPGFQAGGIVEIVEGKKIFVQTGLLISSQKCVFEKNNLEEFGYLKDATLNVTYLRLPIYIGLKKDLGNMTFLAFGGGYYGLAVGGKIEEQKIEFGKGKMMPRFDVGLTLAPGLQFGNIQAALEYSFGLWSNEANSATQFTLNNGFALNLTYLFASK